MTFPSLKDGVTLAELIQKWHQYRIAGGKRGVDSYVVIISVFVGAVVLIGIGVAGLVLRNVPAAGAVPSSITTPPSRVQFITRPRLNKQYSAEERTVLLLTGEFATRVSRLQIFVDILTPFLGNDMIQPYTSERIKIAERSDSVRGLAVQIPIIMRDDNSIPGHSPSQPWIFKWGDRKDAREVNPSGYGRITLIGDSGDDEQHIYFIITPDSQNGSQYINVLSGKNLEFSLIWEQQDAKK